MDFDMVATKRLLARTPGILEGMLQNLDETWTHHGYGENTFSAYDVIGHLIHGEETDWIPRIKLILTSGEATPFEPFDRFAMYKNSQGKSLTRFLRSARCVSTLPIAAPLSDFGQGLPVQYQVFRALRLEREN